MISRGAVKYVAKLFAIRGLFEYSYKATLKNAEDENIANEMELINERVAPIRDELKDYIIRVTKGFSDKDIDLILKKSSHIDHVLNNTLGYMGAGLNISKMINKNRNVKGWDLDIIALYLLERVVKDDFKIPSSEILETARFINSRYDLDNNDKFQDRLAHIGRVNWIELNW